MGRRIARARSWGDGTDSGAIDVQTRFSALNTALSATTIAIKGNMPHHRHHHRRRRRHLHSRFAQNASNTTASTVAIGSIMIVHQIN
jgi:hypothetical protein